MYFRRRKNGINISFLLACSWRSETGWWRPTLHYLNAWDGLYFSRISQLLWVEQWFFSPLWYGNNEIFEQELEFAICTNLVPRAFPLKNEWDGKEEVNEFFKNTGHTR